MARLKLCLAIHNHQPVGNFDEVLEHAHRSCYEPFLAALERHPRVRLSVHYTGPLLRWLVLSRPEFVARLRVLIEQGQVELLGGGLYEPVLAAIPRRDALRQIERMGEFCQEHFGQVPSGIWLAERVWDPGLPELLHQAGVRFTLVDDAAFLAGGVRREGLRGHFVTEKGGSPLNVFPIDAGLRYQIPFREADEIAQTLRELQARGVQSVTYGDDGEKFGLWPGTHEWVYQRGWLERFFATIEAMEEVVSLSHFGEALGDPACGRVYLPAASYEEMMAWALPPEAQVEYAQLKDWLQGLGRWESARPFVRGGIWHGFLARYPEANALHKRMLLVSERVEAARAAHSTVPAPGSSLAIAEDELHQSQCNDAYWHGLFGGLYSRHLRGAVSRNMLRADARIVDDDSPRVRVETRDYDCDGAQEIIVRNREMVAIVAPRRGGSLVALDHLPTAVNVLDVLARRIEGYHRGDAFRDVKLIEDPRPRYSFVEHLLAPDARVGTVAEGLGIVASFAGEVWNPSPCATSADGTSVDLVHEAHGIHLVKKYRFGDGPSFSVDYEIASTDTEHDEQRTLAVEVCVALPAEHDEQCYLELPEGRGALRAAEETDRAGRVRIVDRWTGLALTLTASWPAPIWRYPVETVSQYEQGTERTFQGCALLFLWKGRPGRQVPLDLRLELELEGLS